MRRVGAVVKLQQGEFVDLERVEGAVEADALITCAVAVASPARAAPALLVTVDPAAAKQRYGDVEDSVLEEEILKLSDRLIRQAGLKAFNIPRAVKVFRDVDWTADKELLTPTQKKVRSAFARRYAAEIEGCMAVLDELEKGGARKNDDRAQDTAQQRRKGKGAVVAAVSLVAAGAAALVATALKMK